jgi:hypothetical protein
MKTDKNKRWERKGFTVMELIGAAAVLFLLISCFYASVTALLRFQRAVADENSAIVVLANTLERIEAGDRRDEGRVRRILEDEFAGSALAGRGRLAPVCSRKDDGLRVGIARSDGVCVAEVRIGP